MYRAYTSVLPTWWRKGGITKQERTWERQEVALQRLARSSGHKRTLEIHFWLQFFAVCVLVVDSKYKNWVLEMMAYMIQIIRTNQKYEGLTWFAYDDTCRRQAA